MLKKEGKKTDWKNIPLNDCLFGNSLDAYYTLKVYTKLLEEVKQVGLEKLYEKLISPLTVLFRDIEFEGMLIDENKLQELKKELEEKIKKFTEEMMDSKYIPKGHELSGDDLIEILFSLKKNKEKKLEINEDVGFGIYPIERTKTGKPSTDQEDMKKIRDLVDKEYLRRGLNEKKG